MQHISCPKGIKIDEDTVEEGSRKNSTMRKESRKKNLFGEKKVSFESREKKTKTNKLNLHIMNLTITIKRRNKNCED